jgi:uncharacterized protein (DUF2384 family)
MTNLEIVTKEAADVFGSSEKAHQWLYNYHNVLKTKPIDYMKSEQGFITVMQILSAIKFGGVL